MSAGAVKTVDARYRSARQVMGTIASVHVHDGDPVGDAGAVEHAVDRVFAELERLEAMFSTFRADSEISRINRGELHIAASSTEVCDVLDACRWLDHASDGAFSAYRPDAPDQLDPSGFVKGWAADRASHALRGAGFANWCVNVGGDIIVSGRPGRDQPWRIGIVDPRDAHDVRATIEVSHGAVATSGTAARGLHLWDGRTGGHATAFASLTVIGPNLTWADAFATTAFALGETGLDWIAQFDGYQAMAITHAGDVVTTHRR